MKPIIPIVTGDPISTPAHLSAMRFLLACQHEALPTPLVFFSGDGARVAISPITPRSATDDFAGQWASIAKRSNTRLLVCTSAALRRGVVPPEDAKVRRWQPNWHKAFEAGSLADLSELVQSGAKIVRFGG